MDKSFYKNFFKIYIPLVLQNVITISVNLADNIMLGSYSETALASVAAVNQIQFVYQQLLLALGDGLVIFCSRYWGNRELQPLKKISAIAMSAAFILSMILFCIVSIFPAQTLTLFTTDTSIIYSGTEYLKIIRFTYLIFAITQILLATLRSIEVVKIAFRLSVIALFVNCGVNYLLISGNGGAPELGVTGAAIGTLIARIVEFILLLFFIAKKENDLKLQISNYLLIDKMLAKSYLHTTLPMLVTQGLWGLNTALQTAILGHMTAAAIAANSAASTLFLLVKSTAVGASSTASVLIGKTIGAGDMTIVKLYAQRLQKLFAIIGICSGTLLFFLRIPILALYDLSPATLEMTNTFLMILSVVCVGMSYQMPTNTGIIRGGGDTLYVVKMDFISIWIIVLPVSFFMAFVVKADPAIVVCCLNADQIFKCIPAFIKVNYGNWVKKIMPS